MRRRSQLNGCAYCINMHAKDLLALDEPRPRIYLLPAWRETEVYSPAERAALAWTEAVNAPAGRLGRHAEECPGSVADEGASQCGYRVRLKLAKWHRPVNSEDNRRR